MTQNTQWPDDHLLFIVDFNFYLSRLGSYQLPLALRNPKYLITQKTSEFIQRMKTFLTDQH